MNTGWLEIWKFHGMVLLAGCVLDWLLGDPYCFPHPVRLMGRMITWLETGLRRSLKNERAAGLILTMVMCFVWWCVPWWFLHLVERLVLPRFWWAAFCLETVICYQMLAAKSLCVESMKVCRSLEQGDIESARYYVSMIVGRDTAVLDRDKITRAAVETVAENASDGVIAPLLFMAFLGPAGGTLYKAVNTMDSMIGYKNEKYLHFGRAAAILDDVLNFIPARMTGCLMVLGAFLLPGMDGGNSWHIYLRDRKNHASPNSAHGEAACAGALHRQLAGDAWYFGTLHKKPYIGDNDRPVEAADIRRANRLMFAAQVLLMVVLALVSGIKILL